MDNSVNQATGTISLKARFDNKDNALWPGLSVTTRMLVDTRKEVIVVPQDGVQHGPSGLFAYVIGDNGKVSARPIKVSQSGDANAVVSEGLNVGDRIVVAGQSRLFDGALVDEKRLPAAPMADEAPLPLGPRAEPKRNQEPDRRTDMAGGISAPFIRLPIATSLLMVGILFVGIIAYPQLPVAPLPEVDFPTIQVSASLPGADPETMASSVAQPWNRNSPHPRRLGDDVVEPDQLDPDRSAVRPLAQHRWCGLRRARRHQCRERAIAQEHADPADLQKGQSGGLAHSHARRHLDDLPMTQVSDETYTKLAQAISHISGVGQVMSADSRRRRSVSRSIPPSWSPRACRWRTCAPRSR